MESKSLPSRPPASGFSLAKGHAGKTGAAILAVALQLGSQTQAASPSPGFMVRTNESVEITARYLTRLTEGLREQSPSLLAAGARVKAAEAGVGAVRVWEDPMFKFGGAVGQQREEEIMFISPGGGHGPAATTQRATIMMGFDPRDDGDLAYGLDQKLPLFGKTSAMRRMAQTEALVAGSRLEAAFQDSRRKVAQALMQTAFADLLVELGREDLQWLEGMAGLMQERFRAGSSTTVEVTRTENELLRRREKLRVEQEQADQQRVNLNRLLGKKTGETWPLLKLPRAWPELRYPQRLLELALRNDPRLKLGRSEVETAQAAIQVAQRSRLPDFSLGIEGRQYSGNGSFREGMFSVTMSIPWFNGRKYDKDIARERNREEATRHELNDMELEVGAEVSQLLRGIDAARREAALYRNEIVPRTLRSMESAHAAWLSGRGMSADVFEARRMVIEARTMEARAISEQWSMLSELALCCGVGDLEALDMAVEKPDANNKSAK